MFLSAEGPNTADRVHEGVGFTHHMVEDMDYDVSIDKYAFLASTSGTRTDLKKYVWGLREEQVEVLQHVRDLGSHLNTLRVRRNGTMAVRCRNSKLRDDRLNHMPTPRTSNKLVVMGLSTQQPSMLRK